MNISDNIIKEQLKNVYFLTGGPYGGKTTMAKLIEKKHGMLRYREGDNWNRFVSITTPEYQPAMSMDRSSDWHGFFARPPEQYSQWLMDSSREQAEFAIMDLIHLSKNGQVIADTNIPVDILRKITDYDHVVVLFAPEEMTRKHYFDRADKDDVLQLIMSFPDGEALFNNVVEALHYDVDSRIQEYKDSGFLYIERKDDDTIERTLKKIEQHFGLIR